MQKQIVILSFFILCSTFQIKAQTHISAFKNGTAFVVKNTKVDASKGHIILETLPQATFGTLWFFANGNTINDVNSYTGEVNKKVEVNSVETILKANVGKAAKITVDDDKIYEGMIHKVEGKLVVFKTNAGTWLSLKPSDIDFVELKSAPNMEYERKETKRVVKINVEKKNKTQDLAMMYLQKGISWVPNYSLELMDNNKARLVLRANVLNDSEDIEDANIDFVVGIPNFAYSYLQSPLVSKQSMANFISILNTNSNIPRGRTTYGNLSNRADLNITSQSLGNAVVIEDGLTDFEFTPMQLDGEQAEDLFFYKAKNISLKKGGRGLYDVLVTDSEYEDIYEVNLHAGPVKKYYAKTFSSTGVVNKVWHSIRLRNESKLPWTTGTVMLTKKLNNVNKPLSQDKLNYTPVGAKTKIKLTVSPSIVVRDAEREDNRIENKKKKNKVFYDLITVEAKIEVVNYHNKDIVLNIDRDITGKPLDCNTKWETEKSFNQYSPLNEKYHIEWEVPLKKGGKKEIIYKYEVYVGKR